MSSLTGTSFGFVFRHDYLRGVDARDYNIFLFIFILHQALISFLRVILNISLHDTLSLKLFLLWDLPNFASFSQIVFVFEILRVP